MRAWITGALVAMVGILGGCGDGGDSKNGRPAAPGTNQGLPKPAGDKSQDAAAGAEDDDAAEALRAEIDTAEVLECHDQGYFYDRRARACSDDLYLAETYTCDRAGVLKAFAPTGFQIAQILDRSLGFESDPDDIGEGYILDQCAESDDGLFMVTLVKKDASGRLVVREIEANLSTTSAQP